jgi:excisionase family DNA binding protein
MQRLLYPIPEALELVPFSRTTLYEEIAKGAIAVVKVGRRSFIAHEELERYVRDLTSQGAA